MSAVAIIGATGLPATYLAARNALARCESIDECQTYASKAAALAVYAHQSKDDSLVIMAQKIQARAIRRCGELLKEVPTGGRIAAAESAGLSRLQRNQAVSVAQIPAKQFERVVENEHPKVYQLAAMGRKRGVGRPRKDAPVALTCCPTCGRAL